MIDDDLGVSGASTIGRSGFAELAAQVGLRQVGIVLRSAPGWPVTTPTGYRLVDLAGMADTLIADADGVYHPALFNDRLLLGMKGAMSEAELHILPARLDGGIRNKAARGELRRGLPVGLVWGEADGEIRWHPDEAAPPLITAIFDRFAVTGSVRGVRLWLRDTACSFRCLSARRRHHLGRTQLSRGAQRAHPSCLCGYLGVRQDPPATLCRRDAAEAERLQRQAQV